MGRNYYEILGIAESATKEEIRKAYRRLIYEHHPDRNPDPRASETTAGLNEAYATLSDARKRALYDAWLDSQRTRAAEPETQGDEEPAVEQPPDIRCSRCGTQDSTIRLTLMHYVVSLVLVTQRRGASGVWCSRCRALESCKWTVLSLLVGWWGLPWGPIYTIQALFTNAKGGFQPSHENSVLLRVLGYVLYAKGNHQQAGAALRESLRLEENQETARLYEYVKTSAPGTTIQADYWRPVAAVPAVAFAAVCAFIAYRFATAPSGYQVRYEPPPSVRNRDFAAAARGPRSVASQRNPRVSALVDQLAEEVATRAPVVGTHYEGSVRITDHVLDRSKFSPQQLYAIAAAIRVELESTAPDPEGFVASSYFNAALFALSVDIVNGIDQGRPIKDESAGVAALGQNEHVSRWLRASKYAGAYADLVGRLDRYRVAYLPGLSITELESDWNATQQRLTDLRSRMDTYKAADDIKHYNSLVPEYNTLAKQLNGTARTLKFRSTAAEKLDLAFNRCLDAATLLSRFNRVDLTSRAAETDAKPEPDAGSARQGSSQQRRSPNKAIDTHTKKRRSSSAKPSEAAKQLERLERAWGTGGISETEYLEQRQKIMRSLTDER